MDSPSGDQTGDEYQTNGSSDWATTRWPAAPSVGLTHSSLMAPIDPPEPSGLEKVIGWIVLSHAICVPSGDKAVGSVASSPGTSRGGELSEWTTVRIWSGHAPAQYASTRPSAEKVWPV